MRDMRWQPGHEWSHDSEDDRRPDSGQLSHETAVFDTSQVAFRPRNTKDNTVNNHKSPLKLSILKGLLHIPQFPFSLGCTQALERARQLVDLGIQINGFLACLISTGGKVAQRQDSGCHPPLRDHPGAPWRQMLPGQQHWPG